jgi:hypothetical protein
MQNRGDSKRDEHHEKQQAAERAAALRRDIAKNRPMTPEDQRLVAESLWQILSRAETSGVSKAKVLLDAGIGGEGDSTKHLSQYAIPPDRPENLKHRLNKKPQQYAALAKSCASLAGIDGDATLIELFSKSSLMTLASPSSAAPQYERLAKSLRDIAKAVAAKHDLQDYFRTIWRAKATLGVDEVSAERAEASERLDPSEIEMEFQCLGIWIDWPVNFYTPSYDASDFDIHGSVPPYPTIVLGQFTVGDKFGDASPGDDVDCDSDWDPHTPCKVTVEIGSAPRPGVPPFSKTVFPISLDFSTEIRLCIVPVGPEMWPEAAFRVVSMSKPVRLSTNGYYPNSDRPVALDIGRRFIGFPAGEPVTVNAIIHGTDQNIGCEIKCEAGYKFGLINKLFPKSVTSEARDTGCTFLPVTGTICEKLLGADWEDDDWDRRTRAAHTRVLGPAIADKGSGSGFLDFPVGSVAANLNDLLSSESEFNPLTMLDERSHRLVTLLADAAREAQESDKAGQERLTNRIRSMIEQRASK